MGEMSKLGLLIGLFKHAIWADSLYIFVSPPPAPEDGNRSSFRNVVFSSF
jgi:hypothetical protein